MMNQQYSRSQFFSLYFFVFLSGCAGLIYQVVWHKYLGILLGAQAKATAIILAIFLGGISFGYMQFGKWSREKNWNLFYVYCFIEIGLAVWAFLFPLLFKVAMPLVSSLFGILGINNILIDFFLSILLIGFPTFLMGGTLPVLTQAFSHKLEQASEIHAKIYGFNTLGACIGCLLAGYVLIPTTSLPTTSMIGGEINLIVAAITWFLFARKSGAFKLASLSSGTSGKTGSTAKLARPKKGLTSLQRNLFIISFLSGFYLITLETILIRLMGLSTGSSNYNFTLIVTSFIFWLGAGSLLIRKITNYGPSRLFWNQILVSVFLFLLYLSGDYWSYAVHVLRTLFRDMPQTFYAYQSGLGVGFILLLALPIGFAGITLPLCFHLIKDVKEDLGYRVGQLYGINTIGCVLGALVGGYALLNFIDLDQLFKVCIFLCILTILSAGFLYSQTEKLKTGTLCVSSSIVAILIIGLIFSPRWQRERFIQPFRHPQPTEASYEGADKFGKYLGRTTDFLFWKDGPNTSIGIGSSQYQGKELSRTIFVNGKSDGNTRGDYFTTVMLAHIPALLTPKIDQVCVIGFGTGITIGQLMQYPQVKTLDIAEISNFSISNAFYFDPYNGGVSKNSKVTFHEMDAFRLLQGSGKIFDLIVSEPSNPWVTGIENLYSTEFYQIAFAKLTEEGTFIQWIHTYSFNDDLLRMVLKTMGQVFPHLSVWQLKGGDLAVLARKKPITMDNLRMAQKRMEDSPIIRQMLSDASVPSLEVMLALEIVPTKAISAMAEGAGIHNLLSPKLSNEAAKAFFTNSSANVQYLRRQFIKEFYTAVDESLLNLWKEKQALTDEQINQMIASFCDSTVSKTGFLCEESLALKKLSRVDVVLPLNKYEDFIPLRDLISLRPISATPPKKYGSENLQALYMQFEIFKRFYSPLARINHQPFLQEINYCISNTQSSQELYGECLLQKIVILETVASASPLFAETIQQYLSWFPSVSQSSPSYPRLEEAKNILLRLSNTKRKG